LEEIMKNNKNPERLQEPGGGIVAIASHVAEQGCNKTRMRSIAMILVLAGMLLIGTPAQAGPIVSPPAGSLTEGLVGYWTGNGNADDSSPAENNGSYSGSYATGAFGQLAFNLSTGTVDIPDIPAYSFQENSPGWTIGFWFNGGPGTFLGQDDGAGEQPKWFIDYGYANPGPSDTFIEHINNYGSSPRVFLPSEALAFPGGWNQLTVVNGDGTVTFYLDGQNIGSDAYSGIFPDPTADLTFGYEESCCDYGGLLQDVVLYDRALSPAEVSELAQGPLDLEPPTSSTPEPSGLLLLGLILCYGSRKISQGRTRSSE
jgi:hypothetical protein